MTNMGWSLVELASRLLEPREREAVLGDLTETGDTLWQSLLGIVGLALRRHLALWKNWRPWLASFGLALPCSLLLMGFSLSISQSYQRIINATLLHGTSITLGPGTALLLCNLLLLIVWSWTGGFVMGSLSRRTVRVSILLSFLPCAFCLSRFRVESLSRFCLLLFLFPAAWGVHRGLRIAQIKLRSALTLALIITALTIPAWSSKGSWIPNWALSWPAWYLVATSSANSIAKGSKRWQIS
jgi:hypothetical protein